MVHARDEAELEVLEGDEGEPEVGRHRDVGGEVLRTALSELKRAAPVTVPPDAPAQKAVDLMRTRKVSAVLVVERKKARRVVGIFTKRDLVDRALSARGWARAPVSRFMTAMPETLRTKDPIAYAINKMCLGRFHHVPLVDERGRAAGLVSAREILDFLVELCPEEILNLPPEPELALHPRAEGE